MSCDTNARKASLASVKCGISKIASKAAYANGVAGVAGAVVGGALGGLPGTAIGAAVGRKMGAKWRNSKAGEAAVSAYRQTSGEVRTQRRNARSTLFAGIREARREYKQESDNAWATTGAAEYKYRHGMVDYQFYDRTRDREMECISQAAKVYRKKRGQALRDFAGANKAAKQKEKQAKQTFNRAVKQDTAAREAEKAQFDDVADIKAVEKAKADGTIKYVVEDVTNGAEFVTNSKKDAEALANTLGSKGVAFSSIRIPGDDDYDKERQDVPPGLGVAFETDMALAVPKKPPGIPVPAGSAQGRRNKFKSGMLKFISGKIKAERKEEWEKVRGELNDAITQACPEHSRRNGQWDKSGRFVSLETNDGNSIVLSKAEADLYAGKGDNAALQQSTSAYYDGKVINRGNPAFTTITGDEWSAQFKPERDPNSNSYRLYDTLGEIDDTTPSERIWTLREEDGRAYMSPGIHAVNRLGYYVTENAWHTPNWQAEIQEEE